MTLPVLSRVSRGRLLVVDDDPEVLAMLTRLLRVTGYTVDESASAEDATQKIAANAPDLILLDMQLPGKSGHDLLVEIRSDPNLRLIPVLVSMTTGIRRTRSERISTKVVPVHLFARQLHVEQDEIGRRSPRSPGRRRLVDRVSRDPQQPREHREDLRVVVHDEQPAARLARAPGSHLFPLGPRRQGRGA